MLSQVHSIVQALTVLTIEFNERDFNNLAVTVNVVLRAVNGVDHINARNPCHPSNCYSHFHRCRSRFVQYGVDITICSKPDPS